MSDTAPKARMAVILLDGLADALLYRWLERLYRASEEPWPLGHAQFPKELRRQARLDFGTRVRLCEEAAYADLMIGRGDGPLVTSTDSAILRVGHSYRNAAYHRDRHNPNTIGAVGRLLFSAVADLFVRSEWPGHSSSLSGEEAQRLSAAGVKLKGEFITWRDAAAQVVGDLASGLEVKPNDLAMQLASDLLQRGHDVEELIEYLPGEEIDVDGMLAQLEFQDVHGADAELIRLRALRDPVRRAVESHVDLTEQVREEAAEADRRYTERLAELSRNWRPSADRSVLDELEKAAQTIINQDGPVAMLSLYQDFDQRLSVLEDYAAEAVGEYDKYVDLQIESMRDR